MSMNDILSDAITRIRNAQLAKHEHVLLLCSRQVKNVLEVLVREGYIKSYQEAEDEDKKISLKVDLKYYEGEAVIKSIQRVSKPGCRVYGSIKEMPKAQSGLGIFVVSTSKGVISDDEARAQHVGGEIWLKVY